MAEGSPKQSEAERFVRKRNILALVPGLLHFGQDPLRLSVGAPVTSLRLHLPETGQLSLNGLSLEGVPAEAIAAAQVAISSRHPAFGAPEELLAGRPIQTDRELCPFWEIRFAEPVVLDTVTVQNRRDKWAVRSYGIAVTAMLPGGDVWHYDHMAPDGLLQRLGQFAELLQGFAGLAAASPGDPAVATAGAELPEAAALLDAARKAVLGGRIGPDADPAALRHALIRAICDMLFRCRGDDLRRAIGAAARVLSWLLDRAARAKDAVVSPEECDAFAVLCALEMIERKLVRLDTVTENAAILAERAQILGIEERVNALYVEATGDTSILPIMFRAHGMKGSDLRVNAGRYVAAMKEVEALLRGLGYEAAICYGTFLGAVRTGAFIPHDDDVDMAMRLRTSSRDGVTPELQDLVGKLGAMGVRAVIHPAGFLKVNAPTARRGVDVFPIVEQDEATILMHMEQLKMRALPRAAVLPFGRIELYGESFAAPADAELFLTERYGAEWRTPMRRVGSLTMPA